MLCNYGIKETRYIKNYTRVLCKFYIRVHNPLEDKSRFYAFYMSSKSIALEMHRKCINFAIMTHTS